MGKSNRIRANKAQRQLQAPQTKKQKKEMPLWLVTLLTWVVIAAILLTTAFSLMSANGVFDRWVTVMSSNHYKVDANMMSYFFQTQYQSFQSNYSSFLKSTSLDTSKSLREQSIDAENYYDLYLTGNFEGTWYDYFMNQTVENVTDVLVYCEEAEVRGIELTDEDEATIDATLEEMKETAATYGYTLNSYLALVYGEGIHKADVRRALRYSTLASKCATEIADELDAAITEDRVNNKYTADPDAFNVIDYSKYSLSTSYKEIQKSMFDTTATTSLTTAQKAEVLKKYEEKVAALQAFAEALKGVSNAEEFDRLVVDYAADESYDEIYKAALDKANEELKKAAKAGEEAKTVATPNEEDLAAIKKAMLGEIVTAVLEDKTEIEDAIKLDKDSTAEEVTVYEKTVSVAFAKVLNTVKQDTFKDVLAVYEGIEQEKVGKVKDDEFSEWAFSADRKALETKLIETKPEKDAKDEDKSYTVAVYLLTELKRKDDTLTHNVEYMMFDDQYLAKDVIKDMQKAAKKDLATFKDFAKKNNVESSSMENYVEGSLGYADFDKWLYSDEVKIGDITETPIKVDSYYMVAMYVGDGNAVWYEDVKATIFSEDSTAREEALAKTHTVDVRKKALNKIDA